MMRIKIKLSHRSVPYDLEIEGTQDDLCTLLDGGSVGTIVKMTKQFIDETLDKE